MFNPTYFYNDKGGRILVQSDEGLAALGPGWFDSPKKTLHLASVTGVNVGDVVLLTSSDGAQDVGHVTAVAPKKRRGGRPRKVTP